MPSRARKPLHCQKEPRYYQVVPGKASRSNGNGHCRIHSRAATACRLRLIQGLQEFRHANVRAGIRLATERVKKLRFMYLYTNGAEVRVANVATALTSLLSELETAEKQVGELPVDVGLVLRATRQASGHGASR